MQNIIKSGMLILLLVAIIAGYGGDCEQTMPTGVESGSSADILAAIDDYAVNWLNKVDGFYQPFSATGTVFVLKDNPISPNLVITSTVEIRIIIEAVTNTVSFHIEPTSNSISNTATITISGLAPFFPAAVLGKLYRHQDGYFQEEFKLDDNGNYVYEQDISKRHHIYILPNKGTRYIGYEAMGQTPPTPPPYPYTYNPATRTYTLTKNINEPVVIVANNITLDGAGNSISGTMLDFGYGIYLYNLTNVTVKNCVVKYFWWGICPLYGSGHTIDNNTVTLNQMGIEVTRATGITVTGNTANSNMAHGIRLAYSSYNTIVNNTANNQDMGIYIMESTNNIISGNKTCGNLPGYGIVVNGPSWYGEVMPSSNNILTNNIITSTTYGILIQKAFAVTLTGNTSKSNGRGICLAKNYGNINVYHNNIYNNGLNAYSIADLFGYIIQPIEFSHPTLHEGNWWGRTTAPGFIAGVDSNSTDVIDSYPYLVQDAWMSQPPIPPGVNRPPVLTSPGDKSTNENQLLTFTLFASDPDGDTITYSMVGTPTGATLNSTTGVFNWTPDYMQAGSYTVTFTATANAQSDSKAISITVNNVDRAPVLASPGNQTVNENTSLAFTLSATDLDGDTITYSMAGTTTGATLIGNAFNWTPTYDQAGVYTVVFTATSNALTDSKTISITVNNVDRPPVLTSPGSQTVNENVLLTFTLSATDPDGDTITYSMAGTATGLTLNTTTGVFSWTPDYTQAGVYSVIFTATSNLLSDSKNITITVNNVEIDITPPTVITATVTPDPAGIGDGVTPVLAGALAIKITFSESMNTADNPVVTYDPNGVVGVQLCNVGTWSSTLYPNDTYTTTNANEINTATGDGVATVSITSGQDLAGNTSITGTTTFVININPIRIQNVTPAPPTFTPQFGEMATISYILSEPAASLTLTFADFKTGVIVRTLINNQPRNVGFNSEIWDGKYDPPNSNYVPDAKYLIQITATSFSGEVGNQTGKTTVTVDSLLPVITDLSIIPYPFYPVGPLPQIAFSTSILMNVNAWIEHTDPAGAIATITTRDFPTTGGDSVNWDGTDAPNFAGGGTPNPDGVYGYGIKRLPPGKANPKTGTIMLIRNNTASVVSADNMVSIYYNPSTPGLGTIDIQTVDPSLLTEQVKAIVTTPNPIFIQGNVYDIKAIPSVTFPAGSPALLVFKYDPSIVGDVSKTLRLRRWNSILSVWEDVVPQYIDLVNKQIIAEVSSLSLFALFTGADTTPPVITITSPEDGKEYYSITDGLPTILPITYTAEDPVIDEITSGISYTIVTLNGQVYTQDTIDFSNLLGGNILTIKAIDGSGNVAWKSVRFTVILPASVRLEPEALKVNPGVLTAFVQFPAGYDVGNITDVTCDGAKYESMELSPDETTMVIKFRRKAIEEALVQKGEVIDTQFEIRGTLQIGDKVYAFKGIGTIKKILPESVPPK